MERSEIYKFIKPFKHKKFPMPEMTETEYRKYFEVGCNIGLIRDSRYPYVSAPESILRHHEFSDKPMWMQGNRQSLTYRTNRIEANLSYILRLFLNADVTNWTWEVRDAASWTTLGFVVAKSREEAGQLGKLMYAGMAPNVSISSSPDRPIWSDDNSVFVEAMNNQILGNKEHQVQKLKQIERLHEEIEALKIKSEFLLLNMTAFDTSA